MKIRTQTAMVLSLDKCIGCHTCSVTCKNVWTSRKGVEYAWLNNVETKPGAGYPTGWENQERYRGGWIVKKNGKAELRQGDPLRVLSNIFSNPYLPEADDYYEPFTFDFSKLGGGKKFRTPPSARPYSLLTGQRMEKIHHGPNWEDNLGGSFEKRSLDPNWKDTDTDGYEAFERSFMFYLPRLCEHCLHPACKASCPSGAIYKRPDGVVLIDQDKCRGWRQCISACPYKKIYFNARRKKSEKCLLCYPLLENGKPTVCSESCVGRIRYMGVLLYDADQVNEYATAPEGELYERQLSLLLDPSDPAVQLEAARQGISREVLEAARRSPVYKLMKEWRIALPPHPEYRTMPMIWYIPPLSPVTLEADVTCGNFFAQVNEMRIPVNYLARLLTAGDERPVRTALARQLALRSYMRSRTVDTQAEVTSAAGCTSAEDCPNADECPIVKQAKQVNQAKQAKLTEKECNPLPPYDSVGLTTMQLDEMYRLLALADYQDRFVLPTAPITEHAQEGADTPDAFSLRAGLGFDFDDDPADRDGSSHNLFGGR